MKENIKLFEEKKFVPYGTKKKKNGTFLLWTL
jgi:hypothetical protein